MSSWGSLLLGPKKLQNQQFYIIDWIWKKLLVDVANLATCCHDDYDVLLEVLGTLRKCYVSSPVPKKASKSTILYNRLNKEKTPGRCCQSRCLLLWSTIECFWNHILVERLMNAMLVVLLSKLWFWIENRDWHNCFWMSLWLFVGWTLTGPKKASKSTFLHNRLNKEKTMYWCCQSRYLLLWRTIECVWNIFLVEGLINTMLVVLLPKLWFGLKIMTGHNCFWMSSWGSPLLDPKKLQNQQFYIAFVQGSQNFQ